MPAPKVLLQAERLDLQERAVVRAVGVQLHEGADPLIGNRQLVGDEALHLERRIAGQIERAVHAAIGLDADRQVVLEASAERAHELVAAVQPIAIVLARECPTRVATSTPTKRRAMSVRHKIEVPHDHLVSSEYSG